MRQKSRKQAEILAAGCSEVISLELLSDKIERSLRSRRPLRVKAGFDPSSPDIHLGHTIVLDKLREFQDHGHEVIFIIGDSTAAIGDPSGLVETRPMLSRRAILENARSYRKQAFKILHARKTRTVYNSRWLKGLKLAGLMDLAARVTVSQILERDDFAKRLKENRPVSLIEVFYPLLQAYDSVRIRADVELGGTDQKFNLLMGRHLQRLFGEEPQVVMTLPLLLGTDGVQKMSKSLGNHIGITDEPGEIFGRIMSLTDELMWRYYECLMREDIQDLKGKVSRNEVHPMELKKNLAYRLVERCWNRSLASKAKDEFERIFTRRQTPSQLEVLELPPGPLTITELLLKLGMVRSLSEARRLVLQRAVRLDGKLCTDARGSVVVAADLKTVKAGKRRFAQFRASKGSVASQQA